MKYYIYPGVVSYFKIGSDKVKISIIKEVIEKHFSLKIGHYVHPGHKNRKGHARRLFCFLVAKYTNVPRIVICKITSLEKTTVSNHIKSLTGRLTPYQKEELDLITSKLYDK